MKIKVLLIALTVLTVMPVYRSLANTDTTAPKKILAIQHQTFLPYERSFQGFKKGLEESDYQGKIEVKRFNAQKDIKALEAKINEIKEKKGADLIFSLGTLTTKRVIKSIDDIPVVFTDIGAAEYSGIIKNWKSSGTNVTGVETPKFLSKGINMFYNLTPFKKIGMIYLKGAPSHEGAIKQAKLASRNLGTKLIYDNFSLRNEKGEIIPKSEIRQLISDKLEKLLPRVDAFFVQPSNTFSQHFDLFLEGFKKYGVLSAGDPLYIKKGIVLGLDRDKFLFGKQCAQYAIKIFEGTPPASLPMDVGKNFSISFNLKAAAMVGFKPPLDLLGAVDAIYQDLEEVETEKKLNRIRHFMAIVFRLFSTGFF